jgi:hypothetical protein
MSCASDTSNAVSSILPRAYLREGRLSTLPRGRQFTPFY